MQDLQLWHTGSLVEARGIFSCSMQTLSCGTHAGSSSPNRDQTRAPCIGRVGSYPLDHQGSPRKLILERVIPTCGIPTELHHDRGTHFIGQIVKEICKVWLIMQEFHCANQPQSSGFVERHTEQLKLNWLGGPGSIPGGELDPARMPQLKKSAYRN